MTNTKEFIKAMRERVNDVLPTYYEEAPSKDVAFPYSVLNGINIIDLAAGDLASFYLDIWVDEKSQTLPRNSRGFAIPYAMS